MQYKKMSAGYGAAAVIAAVVLVGCENTTVPTGSVESYALADYLCPENNATLNFDYFASEKAESPESIDALESLDKRNYFVAEHNGSACSILLREESTPQMVYVDKGSTVLVTDYRTTPTYTYSLAARASIGEDLVADHTIYDGTLDDGRLKVTYACRIVEHFETKTVEGYSRTFQDVLAVECDQNTTLYATVGQTDMAKTTQRSEEIWLAKGAGVLQRTVTDCAKIQADGVESDPTCTRTQERLSDLYEQ